MMTNQRPWRIAQAYKDWLEQPEEGWSALASHQQIGGQVVGRANFVSGGDGSRVSVHYCWKSSDESLRGKFYFGPGAQGPPGHVHGGCMAAVLDEVMGGACWGTGAKVLAGEINVKFRGKLPLATRCVAEGRVDSIEGRRVYVSAKLTTVAGGRVSESTGIFIQLTDSQMDELLVADAGNVAVAETVHP
jgi:acyl-coenzyme A thioesterase PaaI-like protein